MLIRNALGASEKVPGRRAKFERGGGAGARLAGLVWSPPPHTAARATSN